MIVALIALGVGVTARNGWPPEKTRQPLPAFGFPDLSGRQRHISEWQGKLLIINFWATWCPPCKKEIPEFIDLQNQYSSQGLQFVGIAIEDKAPVDEYLSFIPINYPVLIAGTEGIVLAHQLGNLFDSVPFTVVVDAAGQIIHRHQGEFSKQQILDVIQPLLANAHPDKKA
jgi:thiol-disulfide isomerase/thioredoxin